MKQIIKDLTKLQVPSEQLKFIDDAGTHKEEGTEIITQIKEVMEADKTILALSAPQIGINKRIFCIRFNDVIKTFINPVIKKKGDGIVRVETNASMPDTEIIICRPKEIEATYYSDDFKYEDNKLLGSGAAIFMQQYELLDGILPGSLLLFTDDHKITIDDIPTIIAGEYSGGGILNKIESEEDKFTTDNLDIAVKVLGRGQAIFRTIGSSLLKSEDTLLKATYKNLKYFDKVALGEIMPVADEKPVKLNRAQRRAAKKKKVK